MSDTLRSSLLDIVGRPEFLARYRGYTAILAQLHPVEDKDVEVMAVSLHGRRFFLHVNIDFFLGNRTKNFEYFPGVLLHEIHHVVLGHLTEAKFRGEQVRHPDLMELAMEISANEYISEKLPGKPPRWPDFQRYGIGSGQSTLERYRLLEKARQNGHSVPTPAPVDTHLPGGVATRSGAAGPGPSSSRQSQLTGLLRRAMTGLGPRPQGGERVAGKPLSEWAEEAGALPPGSVPGWFLEGLDDPTAPPRSPVDWRAALRMFVSTLRTPGLTYRRPNRRLPHLVGQVPGRSRYAQREKPTLLAAIDTSGSMTRSALSEIARQLRLLGRLAHVTVVECDVVVQRVYPFSGFIDAVAGRGGTDFRPVFEPDFLAAHRPDGLVWFTDGCGPYPDEPPRVRTLWVLTSSSPPFDCPWGRRVVM